MFHILVFVALLGSFQVSGSSCKYTSINRKYSVSCKREQYLDKIFSDLDRDGEINSEELLKRLTSTCSNHEEYSKCARCTAKHVCIEERDKLKEILAERWSIYCDDDQPASWLERILQSGFSYNASCHYTFINMFHDCLPQQSPNDNINETSLTALSGVSKKVVQDVFSCSVSGILKRGSEGCGSSWQDILLHYFLSSSARYGMLFYIGKEEIKQLERMRCN